MRNSNPNVNATPDPNLTCHELGCNKIFTRPCDLRKHEKFHTRPFKCTEPGCKFSAVGLPSEKELDRHMNDKHRSNQKHYKCLYCEYSSKRDSNCKQHMEKRHGWIYQRTKGRNKASNLKPERNRDGTTNPVVGTCDRGTLAIVVHLDSNLLVRDLQGERLVPDLTVLHRVSELVPVVTELGSQNPRKRKLDGMNAEVLSNQRSSCHCSAYVTDSPPSTGLKYASLWSTCEAVHQPRHPSTYFTDQDPGIPSLHTKTTV